VKDEKLSPNHYKDIYKLFLVEQEKQKFHTELVQLFEQQKGSNLYGLLKDAFEQYNDK
jgi:hypothetical protein